jgi:hypothetical protein
MTMPDNFDQQVALLLPLYLRKPKEALLKDAAKQRPTLGRAWKSVRQANWLGEVTARATSVQDILNHLKEQGKERWADTEASPRLYEIIAGQIGDKLQRQVTKAIQDAAARTATVRGISHPAGHGPDSAWIQREQLALARLYIGALVAWHRIDLMQEGKA